MRIARPTTKRLRRTIQPGHTLKTFVLLAATLQIIPHKRVGNQPRGRGGGITRRCYNAPMATAVPKMHRALFAMLAPMLLAHGQTAHMFSYDLLNSKPIEYRLVATAEGTLPYMGPGDSSMTVTIVYSSRRARADDATAIRTEVASAKVELNGQPFPLGPEEARAYLPTKTLTVKATGEVLKASSEPPAPLPGDIPGVDPTVFDEWAVFPLVFPERNLIPGDEWTFSRAVRRPRTTDAAQTIHLKARYVGADPEKPEFDRFQVTVVTDPAKATKDASSSSAYSRSAYNGYGMALFDRRLRYAVSSSFALEYEERPIGDTTVSLVRKVKATLKFERIDTRTGSKNERPGGITK